MPVDVVVDVVRLRPGERRHEADAKAHPRECRRTRSTRRSAGDRRRVNVRENGPYKIIGPVTISRGGASSCVRRRGGALPLRALARTSRSATRRTARRAREHRRPRLPTHALRARARARAARCRARRRAPTSAATVSAGPFIQRQRSSPQGAPSSARRGLVPATPWSSDACACRRVDASAALSRSSALEPSRFATVARRAATARLRPPPPVRRAPLERRHRHELFGRPARASRPRPRRRRRTRAARRGDRRLILTSTSSQTSRQAADSRLREHSVS